MDTFLKRVTSAQEELQTGPSRGLPEEVIVVIDDGSSLPVTVPEDLLVGQVVGVKDSCMDDPDSV